VLLVLHSGITPRQGPQADRRFEEALKAAEASEDGTDYDVRFKKAATNRLNSVVDHCVGSVHKDTDVIVLLYVQPDGRVGNAIIRPEGRAMTCMAERFRKSKFPKPPTATWNC